jgi:hypothetical protein
MASQQADGGELSPKVGATTTQPSARSGK